MRWRPEGEKVRSRGVVPPLGQRPVWRQRAGRGRRRGRGSRCRRGARRRGSRPSALSTMPAGWTMSSVEAVMAKVSRWVSAPVAGSTAMLTTRRDQLADHEQQRGRRDGTRCGAARGRAATVVAPAGRVEAAVRAEPVGDQIGPCRDRRRRRSRPSGDETTQWAWAVVCRSGLGPLPSCRTVVDGGAERAVGADRQHGRARRPASRPDWRRCSWRRAGTCRRARGSRGRPRCHRASACRAAVRAPVSGSIAKAATALWLVPVISQVA